MVSKRSYGFMEVLSAVLTAFIMAGVYYLLFWAGFLDSAALRLSIIITAATTFAAIVTTVAVVKAVKR